MFTIIPAIDIINGSAVRLVKGKAGSETSYGSPLQAAQEFAAAGAQWLHIVDLDAAFGRGNNIEVIREILRKTDINIEVCGGIRNTEALDRALAAGAARVNLGTVAVENPQWTAEMIAQHRDKIAVGLDVQGRQVAIHGWTKSSGDVFSVIDTLDAAGCARYVVTDVAKDGTLAGPNLELLSEVANYTKTPIVASGGVAKIADIKAVAGLAALGVEGVIVGKALYSGKFTLPEALAVGK